MSLSRKNAAKEMKAMLDKEGIAYQAAFVDEDHLTLDRRGKPDSLMSRVIRAFTDNTSHYCALTADALKNDVSEIRSQLDKMYRTVVTTMSKTGTAGTASTPRQAGTRSVTWCAHGSSWAHHAGLYGP